MSARPLITLGAVAAVTASVAVAVSGAGAANTYAYYGYAGGSRIQVADATISSDLTVQSAVFSYGGNTSDSKHTTRLTSAGLLTAAAVSTSAVAKAVTGGREVVTTAKTSGVSLLGGAITIDAVTTTSTSALINGTPHASAVTSFAGVHIPGVTVPLNPAKNSTITIPGVASVTLNLSLTSVAGGTAVSIGSGLAVSLLNPYAGNPVGSLIYLSPTYTAAGAIPPPPNTGHTIGGQAYGTSVSAKVGSVAGITSDPTASDVVTRSDGKPTTASVAGVNVATALSTGAVTSVAQGTNTTALADARTRSTVAKVSLLGGLVTVSVLTSAAHARRATGHATTYSSESTFTGLVVAGRTIPLTVKPNTTLSLGSLGKVVVNEQTRSGSTITVRALHVTLSTAGYGLAAGAQIQVGYASASAT